MRYFACALVVVALVAVSAEARGDTIGNPLVSRSTVDTATQFNLIDTSLAFTHDGLVTSWSIYARSTGTFSAQVFRYDSPGPGSTPGYYRLVGENQLTVAATGVQSFSIDSGNRIAVQAGDLIGWRMLRPHILGYDGGDSPPYAASNPSVYASDYPNSNPSVGSTLYFDQEVWRTYSIQAMYSPSNPIPEPTTLALFGLGVGALAFRRRRRKLA